MAKIQKTMSFSNALIDTSASKIIEYDKNGDEIGSYNLGEILSQWDGIYGVSLTIKQLNEFPIAGGERN